MSDTPLPVRGNCPVCGQSTLGVTGAGFIMCMASDCPNPTRLANFLAADPGTPKLVDPDTDYVCTCGRRFRSRGLS